MSATLLLPLVGQAVVGGAHVGEQGVAACLRHLDRVEDGEFGRLFAPGHVVVPQVFVATELLGLLEAGEFGELAVRGDERVELELAEAPREFDVLAGVDRLIAKEDDFVLE